MKHHHRRLSVSCLAAACVLALGVSACGSSSSSSSSSSGSGGTPASSGSSNHKNYTIGVNLSSSTDPFFVSMAKGIQTEAKALGVKTIITYDNYDPTSELSNVQNLLTHQVNAILDDAADVKGSVPAFQAAHAANVPIYAIADNTDPKVEDAFVGAPWGSFGTVIAKWTCNAAHGKGQVAMIEGQAGVAFVDEMDAGYRQYITSHCPGMSIVSKTNTQLTEEAAATAAQQALSAHPNLTAIYTNEDAQAAGAIEALKEAHVTRHVFVTGFDGDTIGYPLVKNGTESMTVALKPYSWGRLGLKSIVAGLDGHKIPHDVLIPTQVLDHSNIQSISYSQIK